jgi:hypothetical protein
MFKVMLLQVNQNERALRLLTLVQDVVKCQLSLVVLPLLGLIFQYDKD